MLIRFFMHLEKLLIALSIILIFVVACTSKKLTNTADSCILFNEKKEMRKFQKHSL